MENWIEILSFTKDSEDICKSFLKLLDDEKIPHKEDIKETWEGSHRVPKYNYNIIVYIPKEYKEKVQFYLNEYNNSNSSVHEDVEELKYVSNDDEQKEYKKREIAKKILALIPFGMVGIVIIVAIISSIIY